MGLYTGGLIFGMVRVLVNWWAYTWGGLYSGGLIFGGLRYRLKRQVNWLNLKLVDLLHVRIFYYTYPGSRFGGKKRQPNRFAFLNKCLVRSLLCRDGLGWFHIGDLGQEDRQSQLKIKSITNTYIEEEEEENKIIKS